MKIKNDMTQQNNENSLIVVMGSHHGIIYENNKNEINKIKEIRIDTPVYSDNEGMFKKGGKGSFRFGSVLEPKKEKAQKEFSKTIATKIKEICAINKNEKIYLFAPKEMKSLIKSDWNNNDLKKIALRFDGNFVSESPIKLIEMIRAKQSQKKKKKEPLGEAKDILNKRKFA